MYVNGVARSVNLGKSVDGGPYPDAVLDTGVPYIIATPSLANAIWGSLGIGPASDGNCELIICLFFNQLIVAVDYLPCSTPLNMTITLGDRNEIPLHPLDISAPSQTDPSSKTCVGLIQQDSALDNPGLGVGDIILGVPFLRNVYTVLAFDPPSTSSSSSGLANPRLGLLNITDPTVAMNEFHSVRVLDQPLGSTQSTSAANGHKLSVGLDILFGLAGIVGLCVVAFVARWYAVRRKMRKGGIGNLDKEGGPGGEGNEKGFAAVVSRMSDEDRNEGDEDMRPSWRGLGGLTPSLDSQRTLLDGPGSRNSKHGTLPKIDTNSPSQVNIHVESDGEESAGEAEGALMGHFGRRRRDEEDGWRESWIDSYSVEATSSAWRVETRRGLVAASFPERPTSIIRPARFELLHDILVCGVTAHTTTHADDAAAPP